MDTNRICVCLAHTDYDGCLRAAERYALVEVRMDLLPLPMEQMRMLYAGSAETIATYRADGGDGRRRMQFLTAAIDAGASHIDIEIDAPAGERTMLAEHARRAGCRVIISHHDFECTPSRSVLNGIIRQAAAMGADIVKAVTTAHSAADSARILSLYDGCSVPLIAFAMGDAGRVTRIAAPLLGAPFTYASLTPDAAAADGQFSAEEMLRFYTLL